MERASRYKILMNFSLGVLGASCLGILPSHPAFSETVFAPQETRFEDPRRGPIEEFPVSAFGSPPARGSGRIPAGFASREVSEMEASGETVSAPAHWGSRSPASMDFGGGEVSRRSHVAPPARSLAPVSESAAELTADLPSAASRHGVQEVAIIASDLGFFPKTVFVSRDVPVRLFVTGASRNTLCIMMDSFQVRKQVRSQKIEEVTFTPGTPGKYRFYCPVNGMEGTLIVKELSTDPAPEGRPGSVARVTASDVMDR